MSEPFLSVEWSTVVNLKREHGRWIAPASDMVKALSAMMHELMEQSPKWVGVPANWDFAWGRVDANGDGWRTLTWLEVEKISGVSLRRYRGMLEDYIRRKKG